jgi:hypothetical protein
MRAPLNEARAPAAPSGAAPNPDSLSVRRNYAAACKDP